MGKLKCEMENNHDSFMNGAKIKTYLYFNHQNEEQLFGTLVLSSFNRPSISALRKKSEFSSSGKLIFKLSGELE